MNINVTSPKDLKRLMEEFGIAPLKKLGQNFLVDGNIVEKIAESAAPENACVLEIGPGFGALTGRLLARGGEVAAYEIDAGLARALSSLYEGESRFHLFHKDFLKADIDTELAELFDNNEVYVAANLPYYITSACIMALLTAKLNIKRITVMVQKEVADRLCASPGSKDYGALTAAVSFFSVPKRLFNVSPSCFYPRPDVESTVVQMELVSKPGEDADEYLNTVRSLFAMRRKTVRSNLRQSLGISKDEAEELLDAAGVDGNARAESFTVSDFLAVSKKICEKSKKY